MEKKDKKTLIVFILLIIAIILVLSINAYKTKKIDNVDRKIEYIMGYTYDAILNKGESLFSHAIDLLTNENVFEYETNLDNSIRTFVINNVKNYKKINNFSIASNTFNKNSLKDYMEYKKIIYFENDYYIESDKYEKNNYIGSILNIENYNDNRIYFKSINYYCDNANYIGILDNIPECNYTSNETEFIIELENNIFKVSNFEKIRLIIK